MGRERTAGSGEDAADLEPCPLAAARLDGAARLADDVLDDREPETRAARGAGVVGAVEALEQPRQLLLVDADAVIAAAQDDGVALALDREHEACVPGPA